MSQIKDNIKAYMIEPFNKHTQRVYYEAERCQLVNPYTYQALSKIREEENYYFKVSFNYSGKALFYLEWSDDSDLDMYIYDGDGLQLYKNNSTNHRTTLSGKSFILCNGIDINKGDSYIIGIRGCDTDKLYTKYMLKVKIYNNIYHYNNSLEKMKSDYRSESLLSSKYSFKAWRDRKLLIYGDEGTDIAYLQRVLCKLEYYNYDFNGRFCARTLRALKEFQRDWEIVEDGIVGVQTRRIMEEAMHRRRHDTYSINSPLLTKGINTKGLTRKLNIDMLSLAF